MRPRVGWLVSLSAPLSANFSKLNLYISSFDGRTGFWMDLCSPGAEINHISPSHSLLPLWFRWTGPIKYVKVSDQVHDSIWVLTNSCHAMHVFNSKNIYVRYFRILNFWATRFRFFSAIAWFEVLDLISISVQQAIHLGHLHPKCKFWEPVWRIFL